MGFGGIMGFYTLYSLGIMGFGRIMGFYTYIYSLG
jgi:hypothetical protein